MLDQLLKHLSDGTWTLEHQELITNVHCQLFAIISNPASEARNVLRLLSKLIIKTFELLHSQCNEEARESLRGETLLTLMKPSLGTQTAVVFDKVREVAMKTALSTVAASSEANGKKNKQKLRLQFQALLKLADDLVAINHKKTDQIVKVIAVLLQNCLKEDELVNKQKDLLPKAFDFVVELLLKAYAQQSQSMVNEDNDASIDVDEE